MFYGFLRLINEGEIMYINQFINLDIVLTIDNVYTIIFLSKK
jgi:hypothetical protein